MAFFLSTCAGSHFGCANAPLETATSAITYGAETSGEASVVALLRAGKPECTGTLIAPRVVVTAAHCLEVPLDTVTFGPDPTKPESSKKILLTRAHPRYDYVTRANDIALVLMAEKADTAPSPFATDGSGLVVDAKAKIVGFGHTERGDLDGARKRLGYAVISRKGELDFELHPGPSQPCFGDSGGPVFLETAGKSTLIGVVSEGDKSCTTYARITRFDAFLKGFIAPFLDEMSEHVGHLGKRCYYPENCASNVCSAPLDASRIATCSQVCSEGSPCPTGSACVLGADGVSYCRLPGVSPGAFGSTCSIDEECVDSRCVNNGASSLCSNQCLPQFKNSCPANYACKQDPSRISSWSCFPAPAPSEPPAASCSTTSVGQRSRLQLLLSTLGLFLLRRRRVS